MDRQNLKHSVYLRMAQLISELGTCCRLKVGAVLLSADHRVVGTGYNGVGPGMPHCDEAFCNCRSRCFRTRHAEENALDTCRERPAVAYLTHEPCLKCTQSLITAGVREIHFLHPYTSMPIEESNARKEWMDHYGIVLHHHPSTIFH